MKNKQILSLLLTSVTFAGLQAQAQTTPTGAATSTTYPAGAVVSDSTPASKTSRSQQRATKRDRSRRNTTNQRSQRDAGGTQTSSQEGQYRQSSAANGTAVNNSNSTNYNSNNATNPPTGVGSNPTVSENPVTTTGSSSGSSTSAGNGSANSSTGNGSPKTGTAAAVTGARTTETPAVKAGSTERNTSIRDLVASSPNYTTLQNAFQSAGIDQLFGVGEGPYTVFAPLNSAFKKLPANIQSGLLEGRNRDALKQLLSYHVMQGSVSAAELTQRVKAGNGKAQLQMLSGGTLTAQLGTGGKITLTDEQGKMTSIDGADNYQANGVIHSINTVLMSKAGASAFR